MFRLWERWGAALGFLAVGLWIIAFAISSDSPDSHASDAKISAWYASSSHQNRQISAFFVFLAGVLCLIGFLGALRERLANSEDQPPRISQVAFGAGLVSAALLVLGLISFAAPAFTASDTSASDVAPATFRMLNTVGYMSWVAAIIIAAITVWATAAIALRTRMLPNWYGWLGIIVGVIQLFAVVFIPIFVFWAWIVLTAALFTWRRPGLGSNKADPISEKRAMGSSDGL
jgi:hypothetical protein